MQPQPRATRVRHGVLVMLFITVVINYLDRNNLSVAAIDITKDLGLDPKQKGWMLSAFGWTYATLQIPGGWLVDRIRPRWGLSGRCCGICFTASRWNPGASTKRSCNTSKPAAA